MFAVQQAAPALDALEGIVRRVVLVLVESEVVLVGLFILELFDVSPDDDTDIELEEKTDNVADDETNLPVRGEHRATRDLIEAVVVALDHRALGKHDVEGESGQGDREEEADPDEDRVGLDHATVSNHRTDESKERDNGDNGENDTSNDETDPGARCDFDLGVLQEVRSRIDSVDEPEKRAGGETAADEGEERGDEDGDPDWKAATEVSAVTHRGVGSR